MPRKIESFLIDGPAGKLEAVLEEPEEGPAVEAALVCHPHPLYGGTMHNKVVHRLARGLRLSGAVVLRFNFRGAGRSTGVHDRGKGELADAAACLEWLRASYPEVRYAIAGFSFGARIAMRLGCRLGTAARLIAAGFPTGSGMPEGLSRCAVSKIFLQSTHDQYGPRQELEALFATLPEPKHLIWVEARDHFFSGGLDRLEEAVRSVSVAPGG